MNDQKNMTLVLADLNKDVKLKELLETFLPLGEIIGVKITKRPLEDKTIHVGFVTFEDAEVARKYMTENNNTITLRGQQIEIAFAKRGTSRRNDAYPRPSFHPTKLYVKGLPKEYSEEEIARLLGNCQISMPKDNKGYCFATYESVEKRNEAVNSLNGTNINDDHTLTLAPAVVGGPRHGDRKGGFKGKRDFVKKDGERKEQVMN